MDDCLVLPVEGSDKDDDQFKGKETNDEGGDADDFVFHGVGLVSCGRGSGGTPSSGFGGKLFCSH